MDKIQQYGARCRTVNPVNNYLNENVADYTRKDNWSPNSCYLNLLDYAIWNMMKKILYKHVKRYEDIEGLSTAISVAWDRLTKKFTCNSIDQWRMRLENVVQESGGHTELLIWRQSHPITYISIVIDTLFINRKLNTIKWL